MNTRQFLRHYRSRRNRQRQWGREEPAYSVHFNSEVVHHPANAPQKARKIRNQLSISMPRVASIGLMESHADASTP